MPDDPTAVTTVPTAEDDDARRAREAGLARCGGCGMRNPGNRRSCLACGAPLGAGEDVTSALPIDPPLLEREAERRTLEEIARRFVTSREGGLVLIAAPRGTGTTRLLRHVAEWLLAAPGVRILTTTVREADGPYAPMTRLLWERFGVTPAKGAQTARGEIVAEVQRVLATRSAPPAEHARRIVIAAGLRSDPSGPWEAEAERAVPRLAESVARFIQADAEAQPTAVLIDQLGAASEEGFAMFRAIAAALARSPVLFVVAAEPAIADRLRDLARAVVQPARLSRDALAQLCRHLLPGAAAVPDELVEAVASRAEGAPGRVREILLALIDSGAIGVDEAPWRINLDKLGPRSPISSADLHEVRVMQLDAEARAVLNRAAVVGEVFWEGAVVAMTRVEEGAGDPFGEDAVHARVHDALRRLIAAELVSPIEESELALEREYAFAVAGLRELLLRRQDESIRRTRHDVCAGWLELAAGSRADDLARAIGGHLEKAGLRDAAGRAYLRAARAARASYRGRHAVELFDRALALVSPGDAPTRIDAMHDRGVVLSLLGRVDEADAAFRQMLELAHRYGARNKMAAALGRLGRLLRGKGEIEDARALLWRALELFQQAEDLRGVAAVQDDLGMLAYLAGDFDAAIEHSSRALEIRRQIDDPLGEALSTHNLGLVHHARGQPRQAKAHFERALALREKHGDVEGTVGTRNVLAALAYERGDIEQAEKIWGEILELAEALGDRRMMAYASHNLGEAALGYGNTTRAAERLDVAERISTELGDRRALAEVERSRGALYRAKGDGERARQHLERSLSIASSLGVKEAEALALRGLGEICAMTVFDASGEVARQAEQYFQEATRILEELGATRELARTRASYGSYLIERGDVQAGRKLLTLAVPVLERLELLEAGRARKQLNAVGGELLIPGQ